MAGRRWARRIVILVVVLAGAACATWFAVQRVVQRQVVAQLAALNGAAVEVDGLRLGMHRQTIRGLRLLDPATGRQTWVEVAQADVELSLWSLLQGAPRPATVQLRGVLLRLRFDADGQLATRLPAAGTAGLSLPADRVWLIDGRLEISQPGRERFTIDFEQLDARQEASQIVVRGRSGSLLEAAWSFAADTDRASGRTAWSVRSEMANLRSDQLASLPLLPDRALEDVDFAVVAAVTASGSLGGAEAASYQLRMEPRSYRLTWAGSDLSWSGRGGVVAVENGLARIQDLQVDWLAGRGLVSGQIDLGRRPWQGSLTARAEDIDLARAAAALNYNEPIGGRLTGEGQFQLTIGDRLRTVRGSASGRVSQPTIRGLPLDPLVAELQFEQSFVPDQQPAGAHQPTGTLQLRGGARGLTWEQLRRGFNLGPAGPAANVAGSLSLDGSLRLPLATASDPSTWSADAMVRVAGPQLDELKLQEFTSRLQLQDGVVQLLESQARGPGQATLEVDARLNLRDAEPALDARIVFQDLRSRDFAHWWPDDAAALDATVSGRVTTSVPWRRWDQWDAWRVEGQAAAAQLDAWGTTLSHVSLELSLGDRSLHCRNIRGQWEQLPLSGELRVNLTRPFVFAGQLAPEPFSLRTVAARLPMAWESLQGDLQVSASLSGQLTPFQWQLEGTARSAQLTLPPWSGSNVDAVWSANREGVHVAQARGDALGGSVRLKGTIPWSGQGIEVSGAFERIEAGELTSRLPADSTVDFSGQIAGTFQAADPLDATARSVRATFRGLRAEAQGLRVEELSGTVENERRAWRCSAVGKTLDGTLELLSTFSTPADDDTASEVRGNVSLRGADVQRLARSVARQLDVHGIQGRATASLDFVASGPSWVPRGDGQLTLRDLAWHGRPLARQVQSEIVLEDRWLRLHRLAARVAEGQITGELILNLRRLAGSSFTLQADRVNLDQLALAAPGRPALRGTLSGDLRGHLGATWRGSGRVSVSLGRFAGLDFELAQEPLEWTFAPASGAVGGKLRLSSARLANGRVSGDLRARWNGRWDLQGQLDVRRAEMRSVARALPQVNSLMSGRLSGQLEFDGRDVRSLDSFQGTFSATLEQSQTLMLPAMDALTNSLGLGSPSSAVFTSTTAEGRFQRGIVELERMTVASPGTRMLLDGTLTTRGRLDINVTADTARLSATGVALGVLRPTDFLRRRLIFLHVGGTIRSPVVQPRTAELIEQEVVLFFLPWAVPGA